MISAGIEPVIFTLDESNPTYTVPALVLEAFGADNGYGDMHVNLIQNRRRFSVHGNGITGAIAAR